MPKNIATWIALPSALLLAGCSTIPAQNPGFSGLSSPANGEALVYVYRPKNFTGGGVRYGIDVGQGTVATLPNCSYTLVHLKPGSYRLAATPNHSFSEAPDPVQITIQAGERKFYLLDIAGSASIVPVGPTPIGISSTRITWRNTNEADAVRYMSGCYLVGSL